VSRQVYPKLDYFKRENPASIIPVFQMEMLFKIRNNNTKKSANLSSIIIPVLFPVLQKADFYWFFAGICPVFIPNSFWSSA
jgi:hypothetical protein